jgi:hypothetical protein
MWLWLLISVIAISLALLYARWRARQRQSARPDEAAAVSGSAGPPPAASRPDAADRALPGSDPADADADADADAAAPLAPFNHRRHWAILEGVDDAHDFLLKIFKQLLREGSGAGALVRGELCHMVDNRGHLMFSALLRRGQQLELLAMYPYAESPHVWPLRLERIEESADGLEARLLGSSDGAQVAFYDTLYLKNRDAYRLGDTYNLQVSAIAYQLEPDELGEEFAPDFTGFGPLSRFSPDSAAAPDEVVFHSYIEEVFTIDFWGVPLRVYVIPLARPDRDKPPLRVEVYVHDAIADREFSVGERVRGVLWLFAMWPAPPPELAEAAAATASHLN